MHPRRRLPAGLFVPPSPPGPGSPRTGAAASPRTAARLCAALASSLARRRQPPASPAFQKHSPFSPHFLYFFLFFLVTSIQLAQSRVLAARSSAELFWLDEESRIEVVLPRYVKERCGTYCVALCQHLSTAAAPEVSLILKFCLGALGRRYYLMSFMCFW